MAEFKPRRRKKVCALCEGKKLDFLNEFYNTLENTIKTSPEVSSSASATAEEKICPLCGAPMVIRRSRFGKLFYGCSKYPQCRGLVNVN